MVIIPKKRDRLVILQALTELYEAHRGPYDTRTEVNAAVATVHSRLCSDAQQLHHAIRREHEEEETGIALPPLKRPPLKLDELIDEGAKAAHLAYCAERFGGSFHAPEDCPSAVLPSSCSSCIARMSAWSRLPESLRDEFRSKARPVVEALLKYTRE